MDEREDIAFLWRVIYALGAIVAALVGVVWHHVIEDRKTRRELERVKRRLGLNGGGE